MAHAAEASAKQSNSTSRTFYDHSQSGLNRHGRARLESLVKKYGAPHFPTMRNPVGTLNERFWAAFFATLNEVIYENREDDFYKYGGKIYFRPASICCAGSSRTTFNGQPESGRVIALCPQLCNSRHLGGVLYHLKSFVQKEGVFSKPREYIHVENGVIKLYGSSPELTGLIRNFIPQPYSDRIQSAGQMPEIY